MPQHFSDRLRPTAHLVIEHIALGKRLASERFALGKRLASVTALGILNIKGSLAMH